MLNIANSLDTNEIVVKNLQRHSPSTPVLCLSTLRHYCVQTNRIAELYEITARNSIEADSSVLQIILDNRW